MANGTVGKVNKHFYSTEFNFLNNTNFTENDLFCCECEEIFKTKIYTQLNAEDRAEDVNLCEDCYESGKFDESTINNLVENHFLRRSLNRATFWCTFEQCNFVGDLKTFCQHIVTCKFKPLFCIFDKKQFKNIEEFTSHLLDHDNVRKVDFDSHSITFDVNCKKASMEIILTQYKDNYFLIFIKRNNTSVSFRVSHHYNLPTLKTFTIVQEIEDAQIRQRGKMQSLHAILNTFGDSTNAIKLYVPLDYSKVSIYFMDCMPIYKIKFNDCPICFRKLSGDIRQCTTGHAFCTMCATQFCSCFCPVCRADVTTPVINIKYLIPNDDQLCDNFIYGCLAIGNIEKHKPVCSFRRILCTQCNTHITAHSFYDHFIEKHKAHENFSVISKELYTNKKSDKIFIRYRSNIFCVETLFDSDFNLNFFVTLENNNSLSSSKYQFQITLYINDDVIAKVGSKCGPAHSVAISLTSFKPPYLKAVATVKCQYNIFVAN